MKCLWCCKTCSMEIPVEIDDETYFCCSEECKRKAEKFLRHVRHCTPVFLLLITASVITAIAGSVTNVRITYFAMAGMGAAILIFPFCTPQTVQKIGIKKSIPIGRAGGILIIAMAIAFYLLSGIK